MKYALILAFAVALCPSAKYEFLEVVSGNVYVRDHGLSRDDCLRTLSSALARKPKGQFHCQPER